MSIQATISRPFTAYVEGGTTGLAGIIGATVYDAHGNVVLSRNTGGIIEIDAPSGTYQWSAPSAPSAAGTYTVVWDDGSGHTAIEELDVEVAFFVPAPSPVTQGISPDFGGFVNSRAVLFQNFGVWMAFLIPIEPSYAPGVPLNPFGEPLDPWMTPASGFTEGTGYTSAFASATIVTRPYGGRGQVRDQQEQTPLGLVADQLIGINIMPETYAAVGPEASGGTATHVAFWGERFEIREWRADGIGALQRYVVYLSEESGP